MDVLQCFAVNEENPGLASTVEFTPVFLKTANLVQS